MLETQSGQVDVLILMGSQSDLDTVKKAFPVLEECGITYTAHICSAHRTPDRLSYILDKANASDSRTKAVIACAGVAAHLAGVVASHTTLPVIGVPLASGPLSGNDALYSTVQMPPGIPVATVAINGAANAAWLAARIISLQDSKVQDKLQTAIKGMKAKVIQADDVLQKELSSQ